MAERASSKSAKKKAAKKAVPKGATGSRGKVAKTEKKAGIGHNSGGIPDEVYERHLKKIESTDKAMQKAKVEYDQLRGEHRSAFRAAKSDGVNIEAIKIARQLHKLDHGVVVTDYSDVGRVLRLMESPLATQLDLFQDIAPPPTADATLAGAAAFSNDEPRSNNPHPQGSELYVAWDTSWMEKAKAKDLVDGEGRTIN